MNDVQQLKEAKAFADRWAGRGYEKGEVWRQLQGNFKVIKRRL